MNSRLGNRTLSLKKYPAQTNTHTWPLYMRHERNDTESKEFLKGQTYQFVKSIKQLTLALLDDWNFVTF